MLQMPAVAGQALFDAVKVDLPFGILPLEQLEPPFIALLRAGAQAADDLVGISVVAVMESSLLSAMRFPFVIRASKT